MSLHRCPEPACCNFGKPTGPNCGCHKTDEHVLREQRDALLSAAKAVIETAEDRVIGIDCFALNDLVAAIAKAEARHAD